MIFDPAFKKVWHLFKPGNLFPIIHLSRVEWPVLVPVLTSLIVWLEANMFIKVHGLTDTMRKYILWEYNEHDKYAVND